MRSHAVWCHQRGGPFKFWKLSVLIVALGAGFMTWQEWALSSVAKSTAQELTCDELGRQGYGDNANVKVTECLVSPGTNVFETKRDSDEHWSVVFVPLLPAEGEYAKRIAKLTEDAEWPEPDSFRVILKSSEIRNSAAFGVINSEKTFRGVVINEIASMDKETSKLLAESYPALNLESCWILEHNRAVPTWKTVAVRGALAMALFGLWIYIQFFFDKRPKHGENTDEQLD